MARTFYTLEVAGKGQKTFAGQGEAGWGIELNSVTRQRLVKRPSTFTFSQPVKHPREAPLFAAGDVVTVRRAVPKDSHGALLSDQGVKWFQGKIIRVTFSHTPGQQSIQYEARDAWHSLDLIVFQQNTYQWDGTYVDVPYRHPANSFIVKPTPHIIIPGKRGANAFTQLTCEDQIREVLNYAIAAGVALQIGTLKITPTDYAGGTITLREEKSLTCAQVINLMLDATPDAVPWLDYTTTPPTLNIKRWKELDEETLTIGEDAIVTANIEPLYELQVSGVHFIFERIEEVNNQPALFVTEQKYPADMSDTAEGALVETIDLIGVKWQIQKAELLVGSFDANHADAATRLAWWKARQNLEWLNDPRISDISITDVETDGSDNLPNYIIEGNLPDWIDDRVSLEDVTVRAYATFKRWLDDDHTQLQTDWTAMGEAGKFPITANATTTDAPTGDQLYTNKQVTPAVDLEPSNLARFEYEGLSILHYSGAVRVREPRILDRLILGKRYNLANGQPAWLTMKSMPTSITDHPAAGVSDVQFGPPGFIAAKKIMSLLRENRVRILNRSPGAQQTGTLGSEGSISSGRAPLRNTTSGFIGGGGARLAWL